jgi:hypothetical protein
MNGPDENRQKEDWLYYYALYHMLAHWTAFLAISVLLVTLGVQWNTTQKAEAIASPGFQSWLANPRVAHPCGAALGLAILCFVEFHLLWCILEENTYLLRKLPISAREPELIQPFHRHPTLLTLLIALGTTALTAWDIALVFGW